MSIFIAAKISEKLEEGNFKGHVRLASQIMCWSPWRLLNLAVMSRTVAVMSSCSHVCSVMYAYAEAHAISTSTTQASACKKCAIDFWCFYKLHMYFDTIVAKCTMYSINSCHNRKYHSLSQHCTMWSLCNHFSQQQPTAALIAELWPNVISYTSLYLTGRVAVGFAP